MSRRSSPIDDTYSMAASSAYTLSEDGSMSRSSPARSPPPSPTLDMPSQHSGFQSPSVGGDANSELSSMDSPGPWSPPAWTRPASGWYAQHDHLPPSRFSSPSHSRQMSPLYNSNLLSVAASVPLPVSPEKQLSREASQEASDQAQNNEGGTAAAQLESVPEVNEQAQNGNFFRFAVRAEVQHRTDPIEAAIKYWQKTSWTYIACSLLSLFVLIISLNNLTSVAEPRNPDIIKVAGLARNFEPMIDYSQHGVAQITHLQATGVAVWDLGESVKSSDMTSRSVIVSELEELSRGFSHLVLEMTRFFATVDADVDNIILVIEWAMLELAEISGYRQSSVSAAIDNFSVLAQKVGAPGMSPRMHSVLGMHSQGMSKTTLKRAFHEFLVVLEDAISTELEHSTKVFAMFEALDRRFKGLTRSIVREETSQDDLYESELASLWVKLSWPSPAAVTKFEKNKALLSSLRGRNLDNMQELRTHNNRLLSLRFSLENLRGSLAHPLVRRDNGSSASVVQQIKGLASTLTMLKDSRSRQKEFKLQHWIGENGETGRPARIEGKHAVYAR